MKVYLSLTHTQADRDQRERVTRILQDKAAENHQNQSELYAQLVKCTKERKDAFELKDVWNLFRVISNLVQCPTVGHMGSSHRLNVCFSQKERKNVIRYVETVACQIDGDPLVRVLAYGVLDSMASSNQGEHIDACRLVVDRHLNGEVFVLRVFFPNETSEELVYDKNTLILHAVEQVTWSAGLELSQYAFFEDRGDCCLFLDQKRRLSDVLLQDFYPMFGVKQRLLFKKALSRVTEEERNNPAVANTSFVRWNEEYKFGDCPVVFAVTAQLCALQFKAYHDLPENPDHTDDLFKLISEHMSTYIPERVTHSPEYSFH